MQVYCDKPRYTICAIRYASTLQYSMMYIVFGTEQQKRAQARNTCVHVRRAWESVFIFCFFRFFNSKLIPLIVLIVFQLKTKPSEDCSQLISALGYIRYLILNQVHRLLRRKSAIRLCVYSSQVSCQYEIYYLHTHTHTHTHKQAYTHTYGILWLLRWGDGERRQGSCDEADAPTPMNEIKINFSNFWWEFPDCVYIFFLLYFLFWCSFSLLSFFLMHWTWTLANEMP